MADPSSGRATLLESIRQAGGIGKARLRSVKERKLEKKKQKAQEQGEGTPDAARLQERALRKGPALLTTIRLQQVLLATRVSEGQPPVVPRAFTGSPGWPP